MLEIANRYITKPVSAKVDGLGFSGGQVKMGRESAPLRY